MVDRPESVDPLTIAALESVGGGRGGGAQARVLTVVWLLGLAGVAGFAVAGRLSEPEIPTVAVIAQTPASVIPELPTVGSTSQADAAAEPGQLIVLTSPAEGDPTITAVELFVQGYLQGDAASVRVTLVTDGDRIDEASGRPALALGERPSPTRHAPFLVRFGLPDPRPTGSMVVRVEALDGDGERLAAVRRRFWLGPILRPTLGDDGLLGGLVFSGG